MKDPIVLEGEAVLTACEPYLQMAVSIDGIALTEVFEQDLGLRTAIQFGDKIITKARTKRVRITIQDLE